MEQKSIIKIKIFAIHSPLLLPFFCRREEKIKKKITKVMILSHAFLIDHFLLISIKILCGHQVHYECHAIVYVTLKKNNGATKMMPIRM